jgi:6-phosphogluconolactonase
MIQLFATTNEISFAAADVFVQCADKAIRQHQKFVVALTGGVLQLQLYKLLSAYPYRDQVEWDRVYIFWSNEQL